MFHFLKGGQRVASIKHGLWARFLVIDGDDGQCTLQCQLIDEEHPSGRNVWLTIADKAKLSLQPPSFTPGALIEWWTNVAAMGRGWVRVDTLIARVASPESPDDYEVIPLIEDGDVVEEITEQDQQYEATGTAVIELVEARLKLEDPFH